MAISSQSRNVIYNDHRLINSEYLPGMPELYFDVLLTELKNPAKRPEAYKTLQHLVAMANVAADELLVQFPSDPTLVTGDPKILALLRAEASCRNQINC